MHQMMSEYPHCIAAIERPGKLGDDIADQRSMIAAAARAMPIHQIDIAVDHPQGCRL